MKKIPLLFTSTALLLIAAVASATVNITGPTSLLTSSRHVKAQSDPIGLFEFAVSQTAGETLSSVTIRVNNAGATTLTSADFASAAIYKDNGDNSFNHTTDLLAGSQSTVNVGSDTVITAGANNSITGSKFFIALRTAGSWSSASMVDAATVTLPSYGISTSANSPTVATTTTSLLIADSVAPQLVSVIAMNTSNSPGKATGDSVVFTFSETTNKPAVTSSNVTSTIAINNNHSLLDGTNQLGITSWNTAGTELTLTFGTNTPSVNVEDIASIMGSLIQDGAGNSATGSATIGGTFGTTTPTSTPPFTHFKQLCEKGLPTTIQQHPFHDIFTKRFEHFCERLQKLEERFNDRFHKFELKKNHTQQSLKRTSKNGRRGNDNHN